jgi:hypothetical protein
MQYIYYVLAKKFSRVLTMFCKSIVVTVLQLYELLYIMITLFVISIIHAQVS